MDKIVRKYDVCVMARNFIWAFFVASVMSCEKNDKKSENNTGSSDDHGILYLQCDLTNDELDSNQFILELDTARSRIKVVGVLEDVNVVHYDRGMIEFSYKSPIDCYSNSRVDVSLNRISGDISKRFIQSPTASDIDRCKTRKDFDDWCDSACLPGDSLMHGTCNIVNPKF